LRVVRTVAALLQRDQERWTAMVFVAGPIQVAKMKPDQNNNKCL